MKIKYSTYFFIALFSCLLVFCSGEVDTPPEMESEIEEPYTVKEQLNIAYGEAVNQSGTEQSLKLDFYKSSRLNDGELRPLIVWAHGGSFSFGEKSQMKALATESVDSNFVSASIQYRLIESNKNQSIKKAVIDGLFDMKAAVRFFYKNYKEYHVDTNNIFIGGYSAGGFIALHYAYLTNIDDFDNAELSELKSYVDSSGGLDGNSGNDGYSSRIQGVINISGAILDTGLIDADEPPLYTFHTKDDNTVYYYEGDAAGSGVIAQGSGLIYQRANNIRLTNVRNHPETGGHLSALLKVNEIMGDVSRFVRDNLYTETPTIAFLEE